MKPEMLTEIFYREAPFSSLLESTLNWTGIKLFGLNIIRKAIIVTWPKFAIFKKFLFFFRSDKSYRPEQKKKLIDDIESKLMPSAAFRKTINEPSAEYEKLRRRVHSNTQEMWNYVNSEMIKLKTSISPVDARVTKQIENIIDMAAEQKNSLLHDLSQLAEVDGYEAWRFKEASALSDLVQRRLHYLQNPEDCTKAQKLICRLNKVSCVV